MSMSIEIIIKTGYSFTSSAKFRDDLYLSWIVIKIGKDFVLDDLSNK